MDGDPLMKELLTRYKSVILYIVFGVLTTAVNIIAYWLLTRMFHCPVNVSTVIAWVLSVLFAYVVNKLFVFQSRTHSAKALLWEALKVPLFVTASLT
jgi:putative flippase GtrA